MHLDQIYHFLGDNTAEIFIIDAFTFIKTVCGLLGRDGSLSKRHMKII